MGLIIGNSDKNKTAPNSVLYFDKFYNWIILQQNKDGLIKIFSNTPSKNKRAKQLFCKGLSYVATD